jgi:hypothetical protein
VSNWIQLTSGGGYDFDEGVITGPFSMIRDLAHPLSLTARYVGHTHEPWSVAAHSVAVARTIEAVTGDAAAAAAGLLHDAHEAVIGDIPTPAAWAIGYDAVKAVKEQVQAAIHRALQIPVNKHPSAYKEYVDSADHAALHVEKQLLMVPEPRLWAVPVPDHDWMLAMFQEVRDLLGKEFAFGVRAADIFVYEYARLVDKTTL